jgi:hypothetical protein
MPRYIMEVGKTEAGHLRAAVLCVDGLVVEFSGFDSWLSAFDWARVTKSTLEILDSEAEVRTIEIA